jgi:putative nucleotidyltransferase with HDIG domain
LRNYLPVAGAVTLAVIALPLLAVAQLGPARGPLAVAGHVALAAALSMVLARGLALLWARTPHSRDLVFGDVLLWGWARRAWAERRLEAASLSLTGAAPVEGDRETMMRRVSSLLERRYPYTHGHSKRVAGHAERIASAMGLPREEVERIRMAALVHDIGKINIPRAILSKPGRLTEAEFALVKRHPGDGAVMVAELGDPELAAIVRHHHERLDGRGYPDGLAGEDIPLGARIVAVADTFDAVTSARPYRGARSHREALELVRAEAGTQLDPAAVAAFTGYYTARRTVGWAAVTLAAPQRLLSGLGGGSPGVAAGAAPLAQTACGVGAAALIGACLGGLPAVGPSDDPVPRRAVVASAPADAAGRDATAPGEATRGQAPGRAGLGGPGSVERGGSRPRERAALEVPPVQGGGEAPRTGAGAGQGTGGGTLPEVPLPDVAVPDLPQVGSDPGGTDPVAALEPVTDLLPPGVQEILPPVQLPPVQLPQVQVPGVQVPQLQVPQVQVPSVQLPQLGDR